MPTVALHIQFPFPFSSLNGSFHVRFHAFIPEGLLQADSLAPFGQESSVEFRGSALCKTWLKLNAQ